MHGSLPVLLKNAPDALFKNVTSHRRAPNGRYRSAFTVRWVGERSVENRSDNCRPRHKEWTHQSQETAILGIDWATRRGPCKADSGRPKGAQQRNCMPLKRTQAPRRTARPSSPWWQVHRKTAPRQLWKKREAAGAALWSNWAGWEITKRHKGETKAYSKIVPVLSPNKTKTAENSHTETNRDTR